MKKAFLTGFISLFIVSGLFFHSETMEVRAAGGQTPFQDLKIEEISVDPGSPEIDAPVTYTLRFTTEEEVSRIDVYLKNKTTSYGLTAELFYNSGEKNATLTFNPNYYGTWEITWLKFANTNGYEKFIYNSASDEGIGSVPGEDVSSSDLLSTADVTVAYAPEDRESPKIDIGTITVEKTEMTSDETNKYSMKITDDSGIAEAFLTFKGEKDDSGVQSGGMLAENSLYQFDGITGTTAGLYQIVFIEVTDKIGNKTILVNSKVPEPMEGYYAGAYPGATIVKENLSSADFEITTEHQAETNPPVIEIDSFKANVKKTKLKSEIKWEFSITDDSEVDSVFVQILQGNANTPCQAGAYEEDTGNYVVSYYPEYYGIHRIVDIIATDIFGNKTVFRSTDCPSDVDPGEITTATGNIRYADIEVGIFDDENGIFAVGEGMDADVTMTVEPLEQNGAAFEKLHEENYDVSQFYEIHMNGVYNSNDEDVRLDFSCGSDEEGESYTIKHLLSDGSIQEEKQTVENGTISIMVNEFSPFMIEKLAADTALESAREAAKNKFDRTLTKFENTLKNMKYLTQDESESKKSDAEGKTEDYKTKVEDAATTDEIIILEEEYEKFISGLTWEANVIDCENYLRAEAQDIQADINGLLLSKEEKDTYTEKLLNTLAAAYQELEKIDQGNSSRLEEAKAEQETRLYDVLQEARSKDPKSAAEERMKSAASDAVKKINGMEHLSAKDKKGYAEGVNVLLSERLDELQAARTLEEAETIERDFQTALANFMKTIPNSDPDADAEEEETDTKQEDTQNSKKSDSSDQSKEVEKAPETGDNSSLTLWLLLTALSGSSLFLLAYYRRRFE